MKVIFLPQAEENLLAITEPLFTKMVEKIRLLESFPLMGPAMDDELAGYRGLTIDIFRVLYRVIPDRHVEIAYIRHCKRNLVKPE